MCWQARPVVEEERQHINNHNKLFNKCTTLHHTACKLYCSWSAMSFLTSLGSLGRACSRLRASATPGRSSGFAVSSHLRRRRCHGSHMLAKSKASCPHTHTRRSHLTKATNSSDALNVVKGVSPQRHVVTCDVPQHQPTHEWHSPIEGWCWEGYTTNDT